MSRTDIGMTFALCGGMAVGLYSLGMDRYTVQSGTESPAYRSAKWGPIRVFHMDGEPNNGRSVTIYGIRRMRVDIELPDDHDTVRVEL